MSRFYVPSMTTDSVGNARNTSTLSPAGLLALLLTTFAIGTYDFIIAGALPELAADFGITNAAAGQLVTVFSLTFAVSAPVLAVMTARVPRRRLMMVGLMAFVLICLGTAVAPTFIVSLVSRVVGALVAATLSPAAFAIAGKSAAPERVGQALGTVAAGLTVSLVIGVPIGSWIATEFGWRSTFLVVALLGLLALVINVVAMPRADDTDEQVASVGERLSLLRSPAVLTSVMGTVLGACAAMATYTYIAPITAGLTGSDGQYLTIFIAIVGIAGAIGTLLGGHFSDRWGADQTMLATFGLVVFTTLALAVAALVVRCIPVLVVGAALATYGLGAWGNSPPMNSRILVLAGTAGTEAVALNTSGLYLGVALGGAIGGFTLNAAHAEGVLIASAAAGTVAILVMAIAVKRWPTRRPRTSDQSKDGLRAAQ